MRISGIIAGLAILASVVSCGNRQSSSSTEAVAVSATRPFPTVEVPGIYEGEESLNYYTEHFWDKFMDTTKTWLCDSTHIAGVEKGELEQAFSNYVYSLEYLNIDKACKLVRGLYGRMQSIRPCASNNAYSGLLGIAERYLYDPNSPVRNEDFWTPIAEAVAADPETPEELRGSYAYQAETSRLNRVGSKAADFRFCDKNGKVRSLYSIKADYVLLFFSNPGCTACKEIIDNLRTSLKVDYLLSEGKFAVVNVYIDDDIAAWYDYMPYYPETWYNGYDPNFVIRTDLTYNVRAIPSLYILDKDKTVLAKDAPESKVFKFIDNL